MPSLNPNDDLNQLPIPRRTNPIRDLVLDIALLVGLCAAAIGIFFLVASFISSCSAFYHDVSDDPKAENVASPDSISIKQIEEAYGYCRKNQGIKTIFVNGRVICANSARFSLKPKKQAMK